eukprot:TRINITY_DN48189_c0_g1_i1.p2 TRINITY_DN48189_c0_g1~~TRINITY_DN48189_c0_g1_i1.p2  ORF type:complete len:390 (+),score=79.58 TRINITY_DN48189_c0_g1_i1:67-1236(+)
MARSRGRGRGGRGGGRGGRGQDGRQPVGQSPGVIKRSEKQRQGRGGGRGSGRGGGGGHPSAQRQKNKSGRQAKKSGGARREFNVVVTEVAEEGVRRLQEIPKAHSDAIMAVVFTPEFIYTASRDRTLKKWKPSPTPGGFQLQQQLEVPLGEQCLCMLSVGDWLFCGMGNGAIKGFRPGKEMHVEGHSKRCNSLLMHQNVLISAGSDGVLKLWTMDEASQVLRCTHSIADGIPGASTTMAVLNEHLWVGGSSGIAIVELASLRVVHQLPPKRFVAGVLPYEGHMIVVYADGSSAIFDHAGAQKHAQPAMPAGPVLDIAGLEVGPRLLCGHAKGQVTAITLPMFQVSKYWQALERCKAQCVASAPGPEGIFIVGAENGSLQLWQKVAVPGA